MKSFINKFVDDHYNVSLDTTINNIIDDPIIDDNIEQNNITENNNNYKGGLNLNTMEKPVILYTDYFKEQTQRILKHLNNIGIKSTDITEQLNNELITNKIYNQIKDYNENKAKININIRKNNDFSFIKKYINSITDNYKVISYNISNYLNIDFFSEFKRYYFKGEKILLNYFNINNDRFYESLLILPEIYNLKIDEKLYKQYIDILNKNEEDTYFNLLTLALFNNNNNNNNDFKLVRKLADYFRFTKNKKLFIEYIYKYCICTIENVKLEENKETINYLPLDREYTDTAANILLKDIV